jgi:hypothetical protein
MFKMYVIAIPILILGVIIQGITGDDWM